MNDDSAAGATSLDSMARVWLLRHARQSIDAHLEGTPLPAGTDHPVACEAARGCFVSIHTHADMLRGCIGNFEATSALWRNVQAMALAAATRDPRFAPLGVHELVDCVLEISVLTPREPAEPENVRIGEHGLWVIRGHHRGVLLPQVATANGWDRETFISQTCVKAGMPAHAWRDGSVELYVFAAEVFSEDS